MTVIATPVFICVHALGIFDWSRVLHGYIFFRMMHLLSDSAVYWRYMNLMVETK